MGTIVGVEGWLGLAQRLRGRQQGCLESGALAAKSDLHGGSGL